MKDIKEIPASPQAEINPAVEEQLKAHFDGSEWKIDATI